MTSRNSASLVRYSTRQLSRHSDHMAYLDNVRKEAKRAGLRIAGSTHNEIWNQLEWTDDLLQQWQAQGALTPQLEERVSRELTAFLERVGYRSQQGYQGILLALAEAPTVPEIGRLGAMMDACVLLVDSL